MLYPNEGLNKGKIRSSNATSFVLDLVLEIAGVAIWNIRWQLNPKTAQDIALEIIHSKIPRWVLELLAL